MRLYKQFCAWLSGWLMVEVEEEPIKEKKKVKGKKKSKGLKQDESK